MRKKLIKQVPISILFLLLLAALMRFAYLPDKISFLYDQGRDALIVKNMIEEGKFTLIGPGTDIPGVFHGALHYYLLLPGYFLSRGHPLGALSLYILFNVAAVYLIYLLGYRLFNKQTGVIAGILMATSYGAIAYSRWLSNPSPTPFFMILLIYSLYKLTQKDERFFILLALCWAIIFHAEVVAALFFLPTILLVFILAKIKRPRVKTLIAGCLTTGFTLSSYLFFELRHSFLITKSAYQFLIKGANITFSLNGRIPLYFLEEFEFIVTTSHLKFAVVLFLAAFAFLLFRLVTVKRKQERISAFILVSWLIGTPLALSFYSHSLHHHFLIGLGPGMILLVSYFLAFLLKRGFFWRFLAFGILILVLVNNLFLWKTVLPENRFIRFYGAQQGVTLGDQKKVVDFIYQDARGEKFRYEALGLPYFLNHAWEYLFSWYGQRRYGYAPEKDDVDLVYYLVERDIIDPPFEKNWLEEKKKVVDFVSQTEVEAITVIKAKRHN